MFFRVADLAMYSAIDLYGNRIETVMNITIFLRRRRIGNKIISTADTRTDILRPTSFDNNI